MIASEKSHQNLSDNIQFLLKKDFNLIRKDIISSEKIRNSVMFTCSPEIIFNPSRYTGIMIYEESKLYYYLYCIT